MALRQSQIEDNIDLGEVVWGIDLIRDPCDILLGEILVLVTWNTPDVT
jgi:hypothetical protein